jgi:hypothetical protein
MLCWQRLIVPSSCKLGGQRSRMARLLWIGVAPWPIAAAERRSPPRFRPQVDYEAGL